MFPLRPCLASLTLEVVSYRYDKTSHLYYALEISKYFISEGLYSHPTGGGVGEQEQKWAPESERDGLLKSQR